MRVRCGSPHTHTCICNELGAAVKVPLPPGCDDLDVWLEGVVAHLKADLIIALARCAVADGVSPDLLCNLDLALDNEGPAAATSVWQCTPLRQRVEWHVPTSTKARMAV